MKWYEPTGYALWIYKKYFGSLPIKKLAIALIAFIACFVSYNTLSLEYRLENQINQLEVLIWLASGSYLFIHIFAWVNAKYDLTSTVVEITDTSIYRYRDSSNDEIEPEIYLNEIKSVDFELININGYEFYNCHIKLKPLRSKTKDYLNFGIQKGYFEKNNEQLKQKLQKTMTAKESLSAPIKD